MEKLWKQLETCIAPIGELGSVLNPGTTPEQLSRLEAELNIRLPDDFKQAWLIHNGDSNDYFLFDSFSLYPVATILEYNLRHRKDSPESYSRIQDDSGIIKDCISNPHWIEIGYDGGSGALVLDLDPGQQGNYGQVFAYYEDGPELLASSLREFISQVVENIQSGNVIWDSEAGAYTKIPTEQEKEELVAMQERIALASKVSRIEQIERARNGQEIELVGAIRPNHKTGKHQLFLKGGPIVITGSIPRIKPPMPNMPPMVRVRIRVGPRRLLGLLDPEYRIISCHSLS